jgi:hypothetical protein
LQAREVLDQKLFYALMVKQMWDLGVVLAWIDLLSIKKLQITLKIKEFQSVS